MSIVFYVNLAESIISGIVVASEDDGSAKSDKDGM